MRTPPEAVLRITLVIVVTRTLGANMRGRYMGYTIRVPQWRSQPALTVLSMIIMPFSTLQLTAFFRLSS